jgi:hypothetical protein
MTHVLRLQAEPEAGEESPDGIAFVPGVTSVSAGCPKPV